MEFQNTKTEGERGKRGKLPEGESASGTAEGERDRDQERGVETL